MNWTLLIAVIATIAGVITAWIYYRQLKAMTKARQLLGGHAKAATHNFLGFTLYCTRNRKGNFRVGLRTEKSRSRRTLANVQDLMRRMRHLSVREQVVNLNRVLRGHYAYFGIAGNIRALQKIYRAVERYWHKMLSSRSWKGGVRWRMFHHIRQRVPLLRPKLYLPYRELQSIAVL